MPRKIDHKRVSFNAAFGISPEQLANEINALPLTARILTIAAALRKIQPEAILERLTIETDTGHPFTRLHVEYIADRAAEEARIIERYRNHDPLDYLDPLRNRD